MTSAFLLRVRARTAATLLVLASASVAAPLSAQATPPTTAAPAGTPPATTPATTPAAGTSAPGAPATTTAAAPTTASRRSWYSDKRDFAVGDIITVLIDDYTITTAVKENIASDTRTRDLGLNAQMPSSSKTVGLNTRNNASQNEKGSAKRENRFQNEMSVRIVAVAPNGLLQVKGTKNINVDKNIQDIVLTGWVRAQDVSPQNSVESARLADAQIGYTSPGNLTKPKQGIISKLLGAFWP